MLFLNIKKLTPLNVKKSVRDIMNDLKPTPKDCKHSENNKNFIEQKGSKHNKQNNYKPFHIYLNIIKYIILKEIKSMVLYINIIINAINICNPKKLYSKAT
jgi:hypothetical protein